jgi:tRNA(Ile)-lysidine synthase
MDLLQKFIAHLEQFPSIQPAQKQLLAVSGGVDSAVLCDLMVAAKFDFVIAHCNFQLRGAESERDEQFVRSLERKYHKEVLVKRFDTEKYAADNKVSIQVAARELRYNWFRELIVEQRTTKTENQQLTTCLHYIFTAHHANDNIETVLINFFKGTGIAGLRGILPLQHKIFRPLLFAKKDELVAYARKNNLSYVEDSSNLSDKYTRNFFRHNLIPLLKETYPNVEDNLLNNIQRLRETEQLYMQSVNLHKKKLLQYKGNEVHIPILKLQKTIPLSTIIYEIIKDFGFNAALVNEVMELLTSETGKYYFADENC